MSTRATVLAVLLMMMAAGAGCGPGGTSGRLGHPTALHLAVINQDVAAMEQLLRAGADPRADDGWGRTPMRLAAESGSEELSARFLLNIPEIDLFEAAGRGDQEAVALVLAGDPDAARRHGNTGSYRDALKAAAEAGQVETARQLVAAGLGPDRNSEHTWLHMAAWQGQTAIFRRLIEAGDAPQLPVTVLHSAAEGGHLEIVEMLLAAGADVNGLGESHNSALQAAAWGGHMDVVQRLLEGGAEVDIASRLGWRPIHSALWAGRTEVARLLLDRGAAVDVFVAAATGRLADLRRLLQEPLPEGFSASYGPQPVFWAARCGQVEVLRQFFDNPPALAARTEQGLTLLHVAAQSGQAETIRWLVARGANLEAAAKEGLSGYYEMVPLCAAAAAGNIEGARALLDLGANIEATTARDSPGHGYAYSGSTPLVVAAAEGHVEMVAFLLDRGADVNSVATPPTTALGEAASGGHLEVCRLLFKRGAKVNGKPGNDASFNGRAPLYRAAASGHLDIVKLLVEADAKVDIGADEPKWPETPLVAAARGGHAEIVRYLLDHGARAGASPQLLPYALESQNAETVRLVLEAGAVADPAERDTIGVYAGLFGNIEILKALYAKGWTFGPNDTSHYYWNSVNNIFRAAVYANHKDLVRLLLAQGFRADLSDDHGHLPLWFAAQNGAKLSAMVLLDAGADPRGGAALQSPNEPSPKGLWPATDRLLKAAEARIGQPKKAE